MNALGVALMLLASITAWLLLVELGCWLVGG
jgi:hypothetical protein